MSRRKYERLTLVHAPLDLSATPIPSTGSIAPLGLLSLATYVHQENPYINIEIIDGDLLGLERAKYALESSGADIIGIGVQAGESYSSALELAKTAKATGAVVVMGGEQATIRAQQILAHQDCVDYVVRGQGEEGLNGLVSNKPPQFIPSLTYRSDRRVVGNDVTRLSLRTLPIPSRDFIDQNSYAEQFQQTLESKLTGLRSFATVRTQDGCMKAIKGGVCTFCVRDDLLNASLRTPEDFWKEMAYLKSLDIDYAWDISPSFSTVPFIYLKSLAHARPKRSTIRFRIYARADDLADEEKARALKEIGIENVLVGFDSGNQACLDSSNKETTIEQHLQAARNLRKYGISTYAGFVLGHLAETYESMVDTLNHARELRDIIGDRFFRVVTCSKMQLYPSSGEWKAYLKANPEARARYEDADEIDLQELTREYFINFLRLDPEEADKIADQIRSLSPIKSGKDMKHPPMVH